MNMQLDRKRSYGTVYGDPSIGFIQDEKPFRHDGSPHQSVPTAASFPTAKDIPESPQVMKAIEALSSQIKELKPEKAPDPARSEKMRQIWVERRARAQGAEPPSEA